MLILDAARGAWTGFRDALRRVDGTPAFSLQYLSLSSPTERARVDRLGALFSSAYLAGTQAKSRALGSLPSAVFRDAERYGRERVEHPLNVIINGRWNPLMTSQDGWQWVSVFRDAMGQAPVLVEWSRGEPVAFWPITVPVEQHYDFTARAVRYVITEGDRFTPKGTYLGHEVLIFKACISTDGGVSGRSLAELGAEDIGLSVDLTRFYRNIIARGFNPGGILETDRELDDDDVRALQRRNAKVSGADHAGQLRIFDRGLKWVSIGSSMAEADIVKQQEFVLQSVARTLYVQPPKMMDFSRATYSNIGDANISFVVDTLLSEVTNIERELGKITAAMGQPGLYVKFELRGLMRGDFAGQMQAYKDGIYAGVYQPAEVRAWEELPFVEGSDELLRPANYFSIDPVTGEARPLPAREQNALAPVVADARERIAARVAKDGDTPKTREFARTVLTPVAKAYELAGAEFDIDHETEEAISGQA